MRRAREEIGIVTAQFSLHGPKTTIMMSPDRLGYNGPPPRRLDDRIRRAVDLIRDLPSARVSRTPSIAREVVLSPSRLRHLFGEQVGVPIRRYRAWKRLRNSIQIASQEPNLLTLAMAAG